jgi:hypothetical protein
MRRSEACSVEEILIGELRQLYRTAQQILSVVPQALSSTPSTDAQLALRDHVDDTKSRLERLNARCEDLGIALDCVHSAVMPVGVATDSTFEAAARRNPAWHPDRSAIDRNRSAKAVKPPEPAWLYAAR